MYIFIFEELLIVLSKCVKTDHAGISTAVTSYMLCSEKGMNTMSQRTSQNHKTRYAPRGHVWQEEQNQVKKLHKKLRKTQISSNGRNIKQE